MTDPKYNAQVRLLLDVLPEVAKEKCFAIHGGTAINLFIRNMPRLSVDIDLTYLPIEERDVTLRNIDDALMRIGRRIEMSLNDAATHARPGSGKILVSRKGHDVKIEVNLVSRGVIEDAEIRPLCDAAQETYDAFAAMQIIPFGQLYGGKINAALDRQHPRDLFDVKILLETEGLTESVRRGFIYCLVCGDRPMHEIIGANFTDRRQAMENQFAGMTDIPFTYDDFEKTRMELSSTLRGSLTDKDREFLLGFDMGAPDWSIYDFARFPAVRWKLQNLNLLIKNNPEKHKVQHAELEKVLAR